MQGWRGEVSAVDEEKNKRILEVLKEKGVEWENERNPPMALETRTGSGTTGFLESLSVSLTGSLLHLPLLKRENKVTSDVH
ncbi:unnamed protein product [Darwinula stevensoni]|uniref:Uncharacterized protein n=1 Tax=Darwinula stevensoni TaxID=69355 RepID=A0A7R9AE44_9CRUS|nr:unnamed protein product [Darwinula stevensoni]CAG0901280.1 unnamed protein product [Darwinula stevensoni]